MKLIIQIPCLNEAATLPDAFTEMPTSIPGIDQIEWQIIDDGSNDATVAVAQQLGVHHIVRHKKNLGLARAFQTGIEHALQMGADIIVNTDGDNQYPARYIPQLVAPLLAGSADIVVGDRQTDKIAHFSPAKKQLQQLGTRVVQHVSGTAVADAASGFRAYSREAALRLNILTQFSYTLETIIQAGKLGLHIVSIPIETNQPTRPSRLQKDMWHFIKAQGGTILRLYAFYEPLRTFSYIAIPFLLSGILLIGRFLFYYITNQSGIGRYSQSVSIGGALFLAGLLILLFGIQADITAKHRQLTQEAVYRLKKLQFSSTPQHIKENET